MNTNQPLKVALIGFGRQGKVHYRALQHFVKSGRVVVCGICDVLPEVAVPSIPYFLDARELIQQLMPDVVVITVPNIFHFSISQYALECGCDVIKEKPLAITLEQGEQLLSLAKKHGKLVITTQQRFYQPLFTTLFHCLPLIQPIHRFSYVFTVNDQVKSWYWERALAGGGSWLNMGWHAMSVLQWYFGQPEDVQVAWNIGGQRDWHYDTDHSALAKLQFVDGLTGTIFVSCIYPKQETLKISGEKGTVILSRRGILLNTTLGKLQISSEVGSENDYLHQYQHILDVLQTRSYNSESDLHILQSITQGSDTAQHTSLPKNFQGASYALKS